MSYIEIKHVHDFSGDPKYPLPHVLVIQGLAVYMAGVSAVFDALETTGAKQKSHEMLCSGEPDDVMTATTRRTYHFEHKSDAMAFRLSI